MKNLLKSFVVAGVLITGVTQGSPDQKIQKVEAYSIGLTVETHTIKTKIYNRELNQFEFYGENNRTGTDKGGVFFYQSDIQGKQKKIKTGDKIKAYYLKTGANEDTFLFVKLYGKVVK